MAVGAVILRGRGAQKEPCALSDEAAAGDADGVVARGVHLDLVWVVLGFVSADGAREEKQLGACKRPN